MPTAAKMIDSVRGLLQSWSLDVEQQTVLQNTMGAGDLTFTVATIRGQVLGISPGIIEIDQELMYCDSVATNGTVTVVPYGRGYDSTTAASHTAGAKVTSQPTFPRCKILDQINLAMERVFPDLFAVRQLETTTTLPRITYDLPSGAQSVLMARWQMPDGRQYWKGIKYWRMAPGGGTLTGDTNVSVDIGDVMMPGRPLQIIYSAKPSVMTSESDDFETVTGLAASTEDVVELAAASAMVRSQELSRLQMSSVEQQNRAQLVAPSAALTSSRFLEQQYQVRLMEERSALQRLYPPRLIWNWI